MALGLTPAEIVAKNTHPLLTKAPHWERVPLAAVARVQNGFPFKSEFFERETGVPLIRIRDIARGTTEHRYRGDYDESYVVTAGDVLVGMDGDFEVAYWRGNRALLNQRVCRLTMTSKHVDPRFVFVCLQPFLDAINAETSSVTVKHLSSRTLEAIPLPLPPFNEQRRIVAKIEELFSELDKGIESLKTAREQLKTFRRAVLKDAFEGKLTARWRERHSSSIGSVEALRSQIEDVRRHRSSERRQKHRVVSAFDPAELSGLPRLPDTWSYVRLDEIADIGSGMSVSKSRTIAEPAEVPYLRVANVQRGRLDLQSIARMTVERDHLPRLRLRKWDVLFNEGGDRDKLGRGWVWESQIDPCITQNHVFRASLCLPSEHHAKFVSYWGNTYGQTYFEREGKQTTNLASINKGVLSRFPVPLGPLEEQVQIVSMIEQAFSAAERLETETEEALRRLASLRQSILKDAFSGKLVPQDPDDEPASVLLERIAAGERVQRLRRQRPRIDPDTVGTDEMLAAVRRGRP